ncbi:MAG: HEAT repeat domain-containing protein [Acidobacteria bacterium]|nr:HEAT repeat domain-containing protein [Acidobacteriota bacterium]
MKTRSSAALVVLALVAGAAAFYYFQQQRLVQPAADPGEVVDGDWLEHLYSQNPKVAEEAARQLNELGTSALPEIRVALHDPAADSARKKAALKACGLLGPLAAPAMADVATHLPDPELTAEAAVALSFMGREAYGPLRDGASSDDPIVRRESLRSMGKLRERAPLDARAVVPLLLQGLADPDPGVRAVAATYLGIIHAEGTSVVPALIETLQDEEAEVRAAAATALGSFDTDGHLALPALRKATADRNENVAREAGLAIVKLQSSSRK